MTPWISRDDATEWPPAWPDTAIVQVEYYNGDQNIGPMTWTDMDDVAQPCFWWGLDVLDGLPFQDNISRCRRLDKPKPPKPAGREVWINEYPQTIGTARLSLEAADRMATDERIALHRVVLGPETIVWRRPE